MINNKILKIFAKDMNIPISILSDYMYYISLYKDAPYNADYKFNLLCNSIDECKEKSFIDTRYEIINTIINTIKSTNAYESFNKFDMSRYNRREFNIPNSKSIYINNNTNQKLMSIDLVSANFQSLIVHDPDILFGYDSYDELLMTHCSTGDHMFEYLKESKYIRQLIFGNLNPKRQQTIQRYYIHQLIGALLDNKIIEESNILYLGHDEFLLRNISDDMKVSIEELLKGFILNTKMKEFILHHNTEYGFFIKEYNNGLKEIKSCPLTLHAIAYKTTHNLPIVRNDRLFLHDDRLAEYIL